MLQLVPVLYTGGLERVATDLTIALAGRVERVAVCTHGGEPFEPVLREAGIELIRIPRPKTSNPLDLTRAIVKVARAIRRVRPHVVHAHNPTAGIVATVARALAALPRTAVVTTYHGVMPDRLGHAVRALTKGSDVVVGVGPSSTAALIAAGFADENARTVYNAVHLPDGARAEDIRREFGSDHELAVTVGRYVEEKDHGLLLDAVARLAPHRPRLRVALVGVGPLEKELRERVRALALGAVVTVTGERRDANEITAAADVFVLSSASEGLPIALLEAMAAGVPVVSTDVGGVGDAVTDGVTGLLVPPGDASALADGIERVLDDGDLARSLANSARAFVARECSPEAMVDRYLDVYLEIVATRS